MCDAIYIGNTQQTFKKIMDGHFSDLQSLLKNGKKKLDSFAAHFVNVFIAPIGFSYFTTLNVIYLHRSVRDVVVLKCCTKWAANESNFFSVLEQTLQIGEMTIHYFFESLLSVTYINSVTHGAFLLKKVFSIQKRLLTVSSNKI